MRQIAGIQAGAPLHRLFVLLLCIVWWAAAFNGRFAEASEAPLIKAFPKATGAKAPSTARFLKDSHNVSVIEFAGNYDQKINGEFNAAARAEIAKAFYQAHPDVYDFLVVITAFPFQAPAEVSAFHHQVKNDVRGIGRPQFDNTAAYGSSGKLQGFIDMRAVGSFETNSTRPGFDAALQIFGHEVMHQWGVYVRYRRPDGSLATDLLGRDAVHWSFHADTDASVMYGNRWRDNANGSFTSTGVMEKYHPLDLYLMGVLPKEQVPPMVLLEVPGGDPARLPRLGAQVQGTRRVVTIDDIIAAEGLREPTPDRAQKDFRFAFIYVVRPGDAIDASKLAAIDNFRREVGIRFNELTLGHATANVFAEPALTVTVGTPKPVATPPGNLLPRVNQAAALDWLRSRQAADGNWQDTPATAIRDTATAGRTLHQLDAGSGRAGRAAGWLQGRSAASTDETSRKLRGVAALAGTGSPGDLARLLALQNSDGGWGIDEGYASDPLDTALALIAATASGAAPPATVAAAKGYLLANQNPDGGWGAVPGSRSKVSVTVEAIRALRGAADATSALAKARSFLASKQNADGGFGDSPSSVHDTALVALLIADDGQSGGVRIPEALAYIGANQGVDGSWQGSVYATALALQALSATAAPHLAVTQFSASPAAVSEGVPVLLTATVRNIGAKNAIASVLRFYDGDPKAGGLRIGNDVPVAALVAGAGETLQIEWPTIGRAGAHTLYAWVDPEGTQTPAGANDNLALVPINVGPANPGVDLLVTDADILVSPRRPTQLPAALTISALLTNAGLAGASNVKVVLWEGSGAARVKAGETTISLAGHTTTSVSFKTTLTKPTGVTYTVEIDPDQQAPDVDRNNNSGRVTITTGSALDLAISPADLTVDRASANLGDDLSFTARLANTGTVDSPTFSVRYSVVGPAGTKVIRTNRVQINAGATTTQTIVWRADVEGALKFQVEIDPDQELQEPDRANNQADLAFTVGKLNGPNLAVSYQDLSFEPTPALEGKPLTIRAVVRNTGTAAAPAAEVAAYNGDPAQGGVAIGSRQNIAALEPGASTEVRITWPVVSDAKDKLMFVVVDPDRRIANEASRADNQAFVKLAVKSLPDLAVSAADVSLTPPAPKPGDAVRARIRIANLGQQDAAPFVVRLSLGATEAAAQPVAADVAINGLAAQSTATVEFTFNAPASEAAAQLFVAVDPAAAVQERNRDNNRATVRLSTQANDFAVSEPYFSPNGDGVKDSTEFTFRLPAAANVRIEVVREGAGRVVRTFSDPSLQNVQSGSWVWDGRNQRGALVPDGVYRLRVVDGQGAQLGAAQVTLDTNRAPLLDALGTSFGLRTNLGCTAPVGGWAELGSTEDGSYHYFSVSYAAPDAPYPAGIYRMNEWGTDLRLVVPAPVSANNNEQWSRFLARGDGGALAIVKWINDSTLRSEIWLADGDGRGLRQQPVPLWNTDPGVGLSLDLAAFTPAGDALIVRKTVDEDISWWRLPTAPGSVPTLLLQGHRELRLAPDATKAVEGDALGEIKVPAAIISLADGRSVGIPSFDRVVWSPDSQHVALITDQAGRDGTPRGAALVDLAGKVLVRSPAPPAGAALWALGWADDGTEFYFAEEVKCAEAGCPKLRLQKLVPGQAASQTLLELSPIIGYDWSHAGDVRVPAQDQVLLGGHRIDLFPPYAATPIRFPDDGPYLRDREKTGFADFGRTIRYLAPSQSAAGSACVDTWETPWTFRSLQNLTADLRLQRSSDNTFFKLRGSAADANFGSVVLEYATAAQPNQWLPVAPASNLAVVDRELATWVPPAAGSYLLRMTTSDLAGNQKQVIKRAATGDAALITDLYRLPEYISPNGDGVQDAAKLHYRVLEPVNLEFAVYNSKGDRVRSYTRSHPVIGVEAWLEWDGRDDRGQVVPDGIYRLAVLNYEFFVNVDSTPPAAAMADPGLLRLGDPFSRCRVAGSVDGLAPCFRGAATWAITEPNLASIRLEGAPDTSPTQWLSLFSSDDPGHLLPHPVDPNRPFDHPAPPLNLKLADYASLKFRINAVDRAGNRTIAAVPAGREQLKLLLTGPHRVNGRLVPQSTAAAYLDRVIPVAAANEGLRFWIAETVRKPLISVLLEYRVEPAGGAASSGWSRAVLEDFFPGRSEDLTEAVAPAEQPFDHEFQAVWRQPALAADTTYLFRIKAIAVDGSEYLSDEHRLAVVPVLAVTDLRLTLTQLSLFVKENLGHPGVPIQLFLQNPQDPNFAVEQLIGTVTAEANGAEPRLLPFSKLGRFLTCSDYTVRFRAALPDGHVVEGVTKVGNCDTLKTEVRPILAGCGETPVGRLRVAITANAINPLQNLVLGRTRVDGSDDIHFNVVTPERNREYVAEIDTRLLAPGENSWFARLTDVNGKAVSRPVTLIGDNRAPSARITYPQQGQKVCAAKDGKLAVEGDVDAFEWGYTLEWGKGAAPTAWNNAKGTGFPLATPDRPGIRGRLAATLGKFTGYAGAAAVRLQVGNWGGYLACQTVSFDVDAAVDKTPAKLSRKLFSGRLAGDEGRVELTTTVGESVKLTVRLLPTQLVGGMRIADAAHPVRTLATAQLVQPGETVFSWDGRNDGGQLAADGIYRFQITYEDGCGNQIGEQPLDVEVDNTPPALAISYPTETSPLGLIVGVTGSVADPNLAGWVLEAGQGSNPDSWLPIGTGKAPRDAELLTAWNTYGLSGPYVLRLRGTDQAGNSAELRRPINIGARTDLLSAFEVVPTYLSPTGSGRVAQTQVRFTLLNPARVSLTVEKDGIVLARLTDDRLYAAGAATVNWDGRGLTGFVPDGDYQLVLRAELASNSGVKETVAAPVVIDNLPPRYTLTVPQQTVVHGSSDLAGALTDEHPATFEIRALGPLPATTATLLARGEGGRANHRFGDFRSLAEGEYTLELTAIDRAGNVTRQTQAIEIDNTAPVVTVDQPAAEAYAGGAAPLPLVGSIFEKNLKRWAVTFGEGVPAANPRVLREGTRLPLPTDLTVSAAGLPDGRYTLALRAEDLAGAVTERPIVLNVDNTVPQAQLTSPAEGGYLSRLVEVTGTATDVNFREYRVDIAPGPKGAANRWSPLGTGTTTVVNGKLLTLPGLPPDGLYTLRLVVIDKAGNPGTALVEVEVDTTPPDAPKNPTATLEGQRQVRLNWTASPSTDVAGYHVLRNGTRITTQLVTDTTWLDATPPDGQLEYTLVAVDRGGLQSQPSTPATIAVRLNGPAAQLITPRQGDYVSGVVEVRGTAYSQRDFKEYRLLVGVGESPADYQLLRKSPVPVQGDTLAQWNTVGLGEATPYTLKLEAEDLAGNVGTAKVTVRVDNTPPPKPQGLRATAAGSDVTLAWTANTNSDLDGYLLYRNDQLANATGPVVGSLKPYLLHGTSYLDKAAPDGELVYTLVAVDLAGNGSDPSDPARLTLDTHAPHLTIVQPKDGSKVDAKTYVLATTPDYDVASVAFQFRRLGDTAWTAIGTPVTKSPFGVTWDPAGLPKATYELQAVGTDRSGNTDPAPTPIKLVYTSLVRPNAPTNLKALTDGDSVRLTWDAAGSGIKGYLIERADGGTPARRITATPVSGTSYTDSGLGDGKYTYRLLAVDEADNESDPGNPATAQVYLPEFEQPYTPTAQRKTSLAAVGPKGTQAEFSRLVNGTPQPLSTVAGDANGRATLADVTLTAGDNRFEANFRDAAGNRSRRAAVRVQAGERPAAVQKPTGTAIGRNVQLRWAANPEPDLFGYQVLRDGAETLLPIGGVSATASSAAPNSWASNATDGKPNTVWIPQEAQEGAVSWLQLQWAPARQVRHVEIHWGSDDLAVYAAKAFVLEAWDGEAWVPLARPADNTVGSNQFDLPEGYRTDRLRLRILTPLYPDLHQPVRVAEVKVVEAPLVSSPEWSDEVPDGKRKFTVRAVSALGLFGPVSEPLELAVGDVTRPAAVTLRGELADYGVKLNWTASPSANIGKYEVQRDATAIFTTTDASRLDYVDDKLSNGTYRYRVIAIDTQGARSEPSNEVVMSVSRPFPPRPGNLSAMAVTAALAIDLAWTAPSGTPPAGYRVYRSEQSGGPYTLVTPTRVTDLKHRDGSLTLGKTYYYVVRAEDATGGLSGPSDEAWAKLRDSSPPAAPVLVFPTVAGRAYAAAAPNVDLTGFAEPGATVEVTSDAGAAGSATAAADFTSTVLRADSPSKLGFSADGTLAAIVASGNSVLIVRYPRSAGGSPTTIGTISAPGVPSAPRFSPDGRFVAVATYTHLAVYRLDGSLGTPVARYHQSDFEFDWSPDGKLTFVGHPDAFNPNGSPSGDPGIVVADPATGTAAFLVSPAQGATGLVAPHWSPDGTWLAYLRSGRVELATSPFTSPIVTDIRATPESLQWMQDSARLLLNRSTGSGYAEIAVFDRTTRTTQSLVEDAREFSLSPDGSTVAYLRNSRIRLRDLASGKDLAFRDSRMVSGLQWLASGYLAYYDDQSPEPLTDVVRVTPPGLFRYDNAPLKPGANVFTARARIAGSSLGAASAPVLINYAATGRADLQITADEVFVLPAAPVQGETARITVTVRNVGGVEAAAAPLSLVAVDPATQITSLLDVTLPALAPGASSSHSANWTPKAAGEHRLIAAVNRDNRVAESNTDNNIAVRTLPVLQDAGLKLDGSVEQASYAQEQDLKATVRITNGKSAFDGELRLAIEDAAGYLVQQLPAVTVTGLGYGEQRTVPVIWNTGRVLAGSYRLRAQLYDRNAVRAAEVRLPFTVQVVLTAAAALQSDQADYLSTGTVRLFGSVEFDGVAPGQAAVPARFTITGPNGTQVHDQASTVTPARRVDLTTSWEIKQSPTGAYVGRLVVGDAAKPLATAETSFRVSQPDPGVLLSGSVSLQRSNVVSGSSVQAVALLRNAGTTAMTGLKVYVTVVDPKSNTTVAEESRVLDLAAGGTATTTVEFQTRGWPLRRLNVVLSADAPPKAASAAKARLTLQQVPVSIFTNEPPVVAISLPNNGAVVAPGASLVGTAFDPVAAVVLVEYRIDGGAWRPMLATGTAAGQYAAALSGVAEGDHQAAMRATDEFGNVTPPVSVAFSVDATPPVITVDGVADKGKYTKTVVPTVGVSDAHLASTRITLNGNDYVSGTAISATGPYVLAVQAADAAGNQSSRSVSFTIGSGGGGGPGTYIPPPVVVLTSPVEGAWSAVSPKLEATATAAAGATITQVEYTLDNGPWQPLPPADSNGNYRATLPPLPEGLHVVIVRAHDTAANTSGGVGKRFHIDTTPPQILIERVVNQGVYKEAVTPIIHVLDSHLASTRYLLNGVAYLPGTPIRASGDYVLTVAATDLAGNTTSRTVGFSIRVTAPSGAPTLKLVTPSQGAVLKALPEVVAEVTNLGTGGVKAVEFSLDQGPWQPMAAIDNSATFKAALKSPAEGDHSVSARVTDQAGVTSAPATAAFAIDVTPPKIVVSGVVDGQSYTQPVTPVITVTDLHPQTQTVVLDGQPFSVGTAISAKGEHKLEINAADQAGNTAKLSLSFTVKETPVEGEGPKLSIDQPQAGDHIRSGQRLGVTAQAGTSPIAAVEYRIDGGGWQALPTVKASTTHALVLPTLSDGIHQLEVRARDQAGRNAGPLGISVTVDNSPPVIRLGGVQPGAAIVAPFTPEISVSDANLASSTAFLNTAPYQPGRAITAPGNYTLRVVAADKAGNITEASLAFAVLAQAPNVRPIPIVHFSPWMLPFYLFCAWLFLSVARRRLAAARRS